MQNPNLEMPILAHRYVPHFVKVGPGPGPVINPGIADQMKQFQTRG